MKFVDRSVPIVVLTMGLLAAFTPQPAGAVFHLMQIEQVIGGVDGSADVQAIQLRMRNSFQNQVSGTKLTAYDASGANPVVLITFPSSVSNSAAGSRILAATAGFTGATNPPLTPDFVLSNPIPESYLTAGSLTFEDGPGNILWRLSWGGDAYSGSGAGAVTNDADGNFNPPFASPLPSGSDRAVLFQGTSSALSTNNLDDYSETSGSAVFTNNAGESGTIVSVVAVPGEPAGGVLSLGFPVPNPSYGTLSYDVTLPRQASVRVDLFDTAGRRMGTLVDQTMSAGRHTLRWDSAEQAGTPLSAGVYWLALTVEGERKAKRFVLLR